MEREAFSSPDEAFRAVARQFPGKTALVYLGEKLTYGRLDEIVDRLARALFRLGVGEQDRGIIYLPHCPQWVVIWLALQRIRAVPVPVTPFYGYQDLAYVANDSGAKVIFCMDTNFGFVNRIFSQTQLQKIIVTTVGDFLPWWKKAFGKIYDKIPEGRFKIADNVFTFRDLLKSNPPPLPGGPAPQEGNVAEIIYTAGTTGFPKGIPITGTLFLEGVAVQREASEKVVPRGKDVVVQGAPLFNILGQMLGIGALFSADTLILLPRVNLDGIFDHIARYRATTLFGIPTLYQMILEHERLDCYNLDSLQYVFSGGDILPGEVAQRWWKKFKKPIYQGYGATETCGAVSLTPAGGPFPPGTVGRLVPDKQVRLVHPGSLEPVPPGEPGELLVSSEHMVKEYWNKPEETAYYFVSLEGKLWYRTGDVVRIDENGWLYFLDRSVDMIKHKGYRISASRIEAVLQEHPAVGAACVIGVPDPAVGERIKAFVVLREGVKGISAYDLIRWCWERIASYEVPQYVEFRDMLPKSKVGKLLRRELREEERRKLQAG
ncbi:MAG: class I adenylate-forming enzyme family protein [Bacillota bacterium]